MSTTAAAPAARLTPQLLIHLPATATDSLVGTRRRCLATGITEAAVVSSGVRRQVGGWSLQLWASSGGGKVGGLRLADG